MKEKFKWLLKHLQATDYSRIKVQEIKCLPYKFPLNNLKNIEFFPQYNNCCFYQQIMLSENSTTD